MYPPPRIRRLPNALIIVALLAVLVSSIALAAPGTLDSTFDSDGKVTTDFGSSYDYGYAVALQADGKIVVAGYSRVGSTDDFAVARYNSDGSLDNTFGSGGKVTTAIGSGNDTGNAVALQADGKIVVAGYASNGSDTDFAVVRYNSDGTLDNTFGSGGKLMTNFGSGTDAGYAAALQTDGKIVVAGSAYNGSNYDFALARYNSDGSLDSDFDSDGRVITDIGSSHNRGNSVALQADGKIVVAGDTYNGSYTDFAVARYNNDGTLDNTFDGDGIVMTAIGSIHDSGNAVALQADGKIVVAGSTDINFGSSAAFAVVRYNSDGLLDTTFDGDGIVTTIFPSGSTSRAIALQADGKIVVAGYDLFNCDFAVARYNSDGTLDNTFGSGGKVTTNLGRGSSNDRGNALALQADGKIIVVGSADNNGNHDFAVARYEVAQQATETVANGGASSTLPGVTITNNSGSACDFTVIKHPVPPYTTPADPGEMPMYWTITSTCAPPALNVDLVFSYTDTELAYGSGIIESNLSAYRHSAGWGAVGSAVNTSANTVTVPGVTALSDWTIGNPTPNAVTLNAFSVQAISPAFGLSIVLLVGLILAGAVLWVGQRKNTLSR